MKNANAASFLIKATREGSESINMQSDFYREQATSLKEWIVLERGGTEWPVKHLCGTLKDGWKKFVDENGIKERDLLVFRLSGDCRFTVDVFGEEGCLKTKKRKNSTSVEPCTQLQIKAAEITLDGEDSPSHNNGQEAARSGSKQGQGNKGKEKYKEKEKESSIIAAGARNNPAKITAECAAALKMAQAFAGTRKKCIAIPMKQYILSSHYNFALPAEGAKALEMPCAKQTWFTVLNENDGTEWKMKWIVGKQRMFSAGWPKFVQNYHITSDDAIAIERLTEDGKVINVIKMNIFRGATASQGNIQLLAITAAAAADAVGNEEEVKDAGGELVAVVADKEDAKDAAAECSHSYGFCD